MSRCGLFSCLHIVYKHVATTWRTLLPMMKFLCSASWYKRYALSTYNVGNLKLEATWVIIRLALAKVASRESWLFPYLPLALTAELNGLLLVAETNCPMTDDLSPDSYDEILHRWVKGLRSHSLVSPRLLVTWNSIDETMTFSSTTVPHFTQAECPPASWKSISLDPHDGHCIVSVRSCLYWMARMVVTRFL